MTAESQAQPQQSWAAWLLDAYANNVVTEPCETRDDDSAYESMSPAVSDVGKTESASPYGPYSPDVEAQKPISLKEKRKVAVAMESIDTAAAMRNAQSRNPSQYVRAGRGGAGNFSTYVQSNDPQASPTAASFSVKTPTSSGSAVMYSGRGGAGNLISARSASDSVRLAKERDEQVEAEKRREQAELHVVSVLHPPSQAHIGHRRRSTLPEDFESRNWA
ncbi:hypothetical protein LTR70_006830 [Exophiala xenobiotica]|uniref:Uncharacterized protein n=1 Tax=Lithohypha guttulata TaxID=1690604 RepID=A0ABR0K6E2_9EURO|nr:hypothetical protein LTR24_006439 [Lithohypha guttulata]KAK5315177.1 hypothetical protein LTR70_006830 [Exophiala xenobiotica]